MTLQQWIDITKHYVKDKNGAKVIPDTLFDNCETPGFIKSSQARIELFHLSDYVVSSVIGGSIWLVPRKGGA